MQCRRWLPLWDCYPLTKACKDVKTLSPVHSRVCFAIIVLGVHDHHQVSRSGHSPGETAGGDDDLHSPRVEQLLHDAALALRQSLMEVSNATGQGLTQSLHITPTPITITSPLWKHTLLLFFTMLFYDMFFNLAINSLSFFKSCKTGSG